MPSPARCGVFGSGGVFGAAFVGVFGAAFVIGRRLGGGALPLLWPDDADLDAASASACTLLALSSSSFCL